MAEGKIKVTVGGVDVTDEVEVAFKPKKGAPGTNIYVVLDRSGSMQPLTSDTIGACC